MPSPIPFIDLRAQRQRIEPDLRRRMDAVLEHGQFILGPEVAEFEQRLAVFAGVEHVVGCANGTDALVLAIRALGIHAGDHVIVPSFTFCATAEAVVLCGAVPVFADGDARTFNITAVTLATTLESCAAEGMAPVGIIAVDLFGQPADYGALHDVVAGRDLWILGDAAQSFGGSLAGRRVGSLARINTLSFFPAKPLGCYGAGGAVLTDDPELAQLLQSLRFHGKGANQYDNVRVGYNSRRDDMASALRQQGIPTGIYYARPLHQQPAYRGYPRVAGGLPVSEDLAQRVLSLPMHPYLEPPLQDRIIEFVKTAS
jgi:dTDP-4-amino-4,6-dideoxygalactose transaminase